jgi:Flp pilus assembly protein TadG
LVEFALVAPAGFLLLLAIIVAGIVVTNMVQLNNIAREGARIAAICGSAAGTAMPDGSGACSDAAVDSYITTHLTAIPAGSVTPQIYVCTPDQAANGQCRTQGIHGINGCNGQSGRIVEVDMSYNQPLYVPLLSAFFQTNSDGTRTLSASAQATCE